MKSRTRLSSFDYCISFRPQRRERQIWSIEPQTKSPRLLESVAIVCRRRHLSLRTEDSYRDWIRHFILFHRKQHPRLLGAKEVEAFLNHLAVNRTVSASTQSQALNALVFLYRDVLQIEIKALEGLKRV
jgi:hypothetical protein